MHSFRSTIPAGLLLSLGLVVSPTARIAARDHAGANAMASLER